MIDYQNIYHVGVLTTGLEPAMEELGNQLSFTWCEVQDRDLVVRTATGESTVSVRFTYSVEGPQHVELLEAEVGSYWDGTDRPGLHHIGLWVDDLTAETNRLLDAGWSFEVSGVGPDGGYGTFSYLRAQTGQLVELVDASAKPRFEAWWAGGSL
ncbi:MAG: VOC family protein [Acidimicrobiales bacterium]